MTALENSHKFLARPECRVPLLKSPTAEKTGIHSWVFRSIVTTRSGLS
jgi:hypothetical protein